MKRILIAGAFALVATGQTLAADLPQPAPPPPPRAPATYVPQPVPYYNWGGIYVGLNAGYGFGTVSPSAATALATGLTSFNTSGFLGGGTLGANFQAGAFVFGVEGDFDYNSLKATTNLGNSYSSNWLATARGRVGYAFDRILVYATGGGAFAPASFSGGVGSTTMMGWTAGLGVEAAFAQNWTAKIEYLYVDFMNPSIAGNSFSATENVIRAGVNYKFSF